jgi:hypothetical protein
VPLANRRRSFIARRDGGGRRRARPASTVMPPGGPFPFSSRSSCEERLNSRLSRREEVCGVHTLSPRSEAAEHDRAFALSWYGPGVGMLGSDGRVSLPS